MSNGIVKNNSVGIFMQFPVSQYGTMSISSMWSNLLLAWYNSLSMCIRNNNNGLRKNLVENKQKSEKCVHPTCLQ